MMGNCPYPEIRKPHLAGDAAATQAAIVVDEDCDKCDQATVPCCKIYLSCVQRASVNGAIAQLTHIVHL